MKTRHRDLDASPRRTEASQIQRRPLDSRRVALTIVGLGLAAMTALSVRIVGLSPSTLVAGVSDVASLIGRMLPPRFEDLGYSAGLVVETFFIAFSGTLLAFVLSLPLAFFAARNTTLGRLSFGSSRAVITVCRAIPDLVFALVFVRALGIGVLPGVLAIGIHSIGMLGKVFADDVEEIDEGPRLAVLSTGAGPVQALATGVVPQIVPSLVGMFLYRLDINVRTSAVLGLVGAGGVGQALRAHLGNLRYQDALGIVLLIFVLIVIVEVLSAAVRARLLGSEVYGLRETMLGRMVSRLRDTRVPQGDSRASILDFDRDSIRPPWTVERRSKLAFAVLFAAAAVASVFVTGVNPIDPFLALPEIWTVVLRFFLPDFASDASYLGEAMLETVAIGFAATLIGIVVSSPIVFLAARNVAPARWIYYLSRYLIVGVRGVPEFVAAVIFVAAVGLGPFAGVMALAIVSVGFFGKLQADATERIKQGPRDAIRAVGATRVQETSAAVVPQIVPSFVSNALYMLDVNIRSSVVLGIVGAGGVGFALVQSVRTLEFRRTSAILVAVFLVVYAIERLSVWTRKQLI